jgi:hypothetical protein
MPKTKHRKNRKPYKMPQLVVIWTNDDWEHSPAMNVPHVQADELAGVPMVTVWDYEKPGMITYGLLGAALEEFGVTPSKEDTLDDLRRKLTLAAADSAISAAREVTNVGGDLTS